MEDEAVVVEMLDERNIIITAGQDLLVIERVKGVMSSHEIAGDQSQIGMEY